jgi:gamma-glutamyl-gamma-aminobutyrate hydrolase PuuD
MTKVRIYIISLNASDAPRLVRAANKAQAVAHIVSEFDVRVASQDDLIEAVQAGVKVEEVAE